MTKNLIAAALCASVIALNGCSSMGSSSDASSGYSGSGGSSDSSGSGAALYSARHHHGSTVSTDPMDATSAKAPGATEGADTPSGTLSTPGGR